MTEGTKTKPDWLKTLEAQSWQAELVASGLAIYGSISMGAYIDEVAEWITRSFTDRTLFVLYFAFLYIYAAQALLSISFIGHLALRILWAGILGLSSVYPEGINIESTAYSEDYKNKLKRDFPDLSEYSLSLDRSCSLIFSVLCAIVIVMASITVWLIIYLVISTLLLRFLPVSTVNLIGIAILGLFLIVSIAAGLLTQSKMKESELANKYAYTLTMGFGKVIYFVGFKAFTYITQTIRTHVNARMFMGGMMGILVLSMLISMPRFFRLVPYFQVQAWVLHDAHPSQITDASYFDSFKSKYILEPVIQSKVIEDNYLDFFIPRYKREQKQREALCGTYQYNKEIGRSDNRDLEMAFNAGCANRYYTVLLDEKELLNLDFKYLKHTHRGELGFQVYIPIDSLSPGNHYLSIQSAFEAGGANFKRVIPFYKK